MRTASLVTFVLLLIGATRVQGERLIIVADHNNGKVIKIKDDGTLVWEARNDNGHDVQLLKNGNLLIVCGHTVQEISPEKKVVREIGKPVVDVAESAQRLDNGNTLIADNGRMKVVEVDAENKVVWEFKVPNNNKRPTPTMRQVRRLDNGNTLICASTEDTVMEVDPAGKIVWHYDLPFPYLATRLANGNTLISSGAGYGSKQGYFVIEVDKDGKQVWKVGGDDAPEDQRLPWPSGHWRLANGNTLISLAQGAAIREVGKDGKTVRTIRSPAMKHPCTMVVVDE